MKIPIKIFLLFTTIILFDCTGSSKLINPTDKDLKVKAPDFFTVVFVTTKGDVKVNVKREYSPLGVDRFYYLVKNHYYDGNRFFRVVPDFVVQWGINGNPEVNKVWENFGIKDEPVKLSNRKGTMAFARGGPNTRSNQLFINLKDNLRLDTTEFMGVKGFPAFGEVVEGMNVIESIYDGYRELPDQDSIQTKGNDYLNRNFPELDYIITTNVIE